MPYKLTKASSDEVERMMAVVVDAWKNDDINKPMAGTASREEQIQFWTAIFKAGFCEPYHEYFKVVDEDGNLVAWTCLQHPAPQTEEAKERAKKIPGPPAGMNADLVGEMFVILSSAIPQGYDPEKHFHRRGTFVETEHQKQGLGTLLTKKCNEIADAAGARTFVPARPSSKKMFEQNGFVLVANHKTDMSKFGGGDYVADSYLLIREPRKL